MKRAIKVISSGDGKLYYGWLVLAVCFFLVMIAFGVRSSMGVFVTPIENEMNWTRSEITRVISLGILVGAFSFQFLQRRRRFPALSLGWSLPRSTESTRTSL